MATFACGFRGSRPRVPIWCRPRFRHDVAPGGRGRAGSGI